MGLSILKQGTKSSVSRKSFIPRNRLIAVVETAIKNSELDEIHPSLANKLREVSKTTKLIAANSWKAVNLDEGISCGCPLTEAGVVSFGYLDNDNFDSDSNRRIAAGSFVNSYDSMMGNDHMFVVVDY